MDSDDVWGCLGMLLMLSSIQSDHMCACVAVSMLDSWSCLPLGLLVSLWFHILVIWVRFLLIMMVVLNMICGVMMVPIG